MRQRGKRRLTPFAEPIGRACAHHAAQFHLGDIGAGERGVACAIAASAVGARARLKRAGVEHGAAGEDEARALDPDIAQRARGV
ncbi:MAG: hypothetical protein NVV62_02400 [Terricaulis sp.]|nr:hypothetical protein [Terricaulis sp.]